MISNIIWTFGTELRGWGNGKKEADGGAPLLSETSFCKDILINPLAKLTHRYL
jgi:hypothetical protein